MATVEDFGTPGYVAPEQAYGRPTYQSDCFAVALILYEYLTGVLPRWPFRWPPRGHKRLQERTNVALQTFLRRALAIDPQRRFANAEDMRMALIEAIPKRLHPTFATQRRERRRLDWRRARRRAFVKRYDRALPLIHQCVDCGEPLAESMAVCPWCGSDANRYDSATRFEHVCPDCHKGVLPEWRFCPWCYGPGFASPSSTRTGGVRYHGHCAHCRGRLMRFMRYCPWCHRKVCKPWQVRPFREVCGRCGWSVDSEFWTYCPWCTQCLVC